LPLSLTCCPATATTDISTLSLHDALPIFGGDPRPLGGEQRAGAPEAGGDLVEHQQHVVLVAQLPQHPQVAGVVEAHAARALDDRDRKSTRLNSSHVKISYAVFCLKKQKNT